MKAFNFIVGVVAIVYGISTQDNICVTLGCMNLILARLEDFK
jgi:hypothetical protein